MQALAGALLGLAFLVLANPAYAHKPSDSYLTLRLQERGIGGQWDIALRDLDFAMTLDADGDGAIRWGEVRTRQAAIAAYALSHLRVEADGRPCWLRASDLLIETHSDGAYAALILTGKCPATPQSVGLRYTLFADFDPQHRGLVHLTTDGRDQTVLLGGGRAEQQVALTDWGRLRELGDFVRTGVLHIWAGFDHLLFLISLLAPAVLTRRDGAWVGQARPRAALLEVAQIVTAFTLAHSITLSLAAFKVVTIPALITESLIALSVGLAAFNNLNPLLTRRVWIAAFAFGLIHGFGFANVLADLGLPRAGLLSALLGFNLGVELGQLAIVAVVMPSAWRVRNTRAYREFVLPVASLAIMLLAMFWLIQRIIGGSLA